MNPHYYIMKNKKILRLEAEVSFACLPDAIKEKVLEIDDVVKLDQNQANWRVVIFRDEIMEFDEYTQWLDSPEALFDYDEEFELIAN